MNKRSEVQFPSYIKIRLVYYLIERSSSTTFRILKSIVLRSSSKRQWPPNSVSKFKLMKFLCLKKKMYIYRLNHWQRSWIIKKFSLYINLGFTHFIFDLKRELNIYHNLVSIISETKEMKLIVVRVAYLASRTKDSKSVQLHEDDFMCTF